MLSFCNSMQTKELGWDEETTGFKGKWGYHPLLPEFWDESCVIAWLLGKAFIPFECTNSEGVHCYPITAFRGGEVYIKVDSRIAIAQLHDPKELHPISLIGFNLPSVPDTSFSAPLTISEFVEPHDERNLQLLLASRLLKFQTKDLEKRCRVWALV